MLPQEAREKQQMRALGQAIQAGGQTTGFRVLNYKVKIRMHCQVDIFNLRSVTATKHLQAEWHLSQAY